MIDEVKLKGPHFCDGKFNFPGKSENLAKKKAILKGGGKCLEIILFIYKMY